MQPNIRKKKNSVNNFHIAGISVKLKKDDCNSTFFLSTGCIESFQKYSNNNLEAFMNKNIDTSILI